MSFKQLCSIVLGAITNIDVRAQVGTILGEAEKFAVTDDVPKANGDVVGWLPTPAGSVNGDEGAYDYAMDECYSNNDDFIPQYAAPTPPVQPQDLPDDLFKTQCSKKMRIHGKQPGPNRSNNCRQSQYQ